MSFDFGDAAFVALPLATFADTLIMEGPLQFDAQSVEGNEVSLSTPAYSELLGLERVGDFLPSDMDPLIASTETENGSGEIVVTGKRLSSDNREDNSVVWLTVIQRQSTGFVPADQTQLDLIDVSNRDGVIDTTEMDAIQRLANDIAHFVADHEGMGIQALVGNGYTTGRYSFVPPLGPRYNDEPM